MCGVGVIFLSQKCISMLYMYGIHQCCYYGSADSIRDTEQLLWKHALFAMRDCTLGRSDPPIPQCCRAFRAVKTLTRRKMDGPICHTNMWRLKSNQICVYCGRGCVDWYEWSASWCVCFGIIDVKRHHNKITNSTLCQVATLPYTFVSWHFLFVTWISRKWVLPASVDLLID